MSVDGILPLMVRKDIIIGLVVLLLIAAAVFYFKKPKVPEVTPTPTQDIEERIKESFKFEIPDDLERVELVDVSDGDSYGIATRKFEGGRFSHVVLADLPEPEEGFFYQGWLFKGEEGSEDYLLVSTGRAVVAKGGYLIEFNSASDLSMYYGVMVTKEKVFDINPEEKVLEGFFAN